ncbi:alpha/beta hydrolase [Pseudomonas sp. J452]|uniref:alpha/beta fold hydrolase n=1 Tax=Pseudomonas sp. J452 TaxID=2898441 RepID=UPI0021ADF7E4|nr:alpha/beta hydrolase [Pseudomonas sp. J452]UUY08379.1 alpha/beta hydrolase [Pseudomonas sp. J452]
METSPVAQAFIDAPIHFASTDAGKIAFRRVGDGPHLIFLHGWPLSGLTYRKLVPHLQSHFTCWVLDSLGCGESRWESRADFSFTNQAATLVQAIRQLDLPNFSIVAHDTGGSIARLMAGDLTPHLQHLILMNTEIPGHRPPWIPLYRWLMHVPGVETSLNILLKSKWYRRSSMGFNGCFYDKCLIDGSFYQHMIRPLLNDHRKLNGQRRYLTGLDWKQIDDLAGAHGAIDAKVHLIWGSDDPTFPEPLARDMAHQFKRRGGFYSLDKAKLLVHEERPEKVADLIKHCLMKA